MTDRTSARTILERHGRRTNAFLRTSLDELLHGAPPALAEAVQYSLFAGGKRLRPALVLETAIAISPDVGDLALPAAGAIELIHTFSLVHDDLPAMDDDDLRRGRPTSHKVFGEAMAILAGDAMTALAFELLAGGFQAPVVGRLCAELAHATGPRGMIGGQVLDIAAENTLLHESQLRAVHAMKTGALIRCACRMGALCGGADESQLHAATEYASQLGLAFQIVDDILDQTSSPQQLGKATQKDARRGKNTYPALLGLESARAQAESAVQAAVDALSVFGPSADGLRCLAHFVTQRDA